MIQLFMRISTLMSCAHAMMFCLNMAARHQANDLVEDLKAALVFHFGLQRLQLNIGYCHQDLNASLPTSSNLSSSNQASSNHASSNLPNLSPVGYRGGGYLRNWFWRI